MTATRALYSLVLWLLQPFLRRKLQRRAQAEPLYGVAMDERFGHYAAHTVPAVQPGEAAQPATFFVWVHAVSLGETRAAAVLVAQLRALLPGMRLLLTHGTATGRAQGASLLQPGDVQVWQPWDTLGATQRFMAHFQPRVGLLMETEIWPNLVAACTQAEVPLCLVNARLNAKSLRQAQRMAWLARPAYAALAAVWAQTEADAMRLRQLGAPVRGVMGNFKYDAAPDVAQLEQGRAWRAALGRPVVLLASAREGEEALWLANLKQIRPLAPVESAQAAMKNIANLGEVDDHPPVQWMVVPRHPQRFDEVAQLCAAQGLSVSRRSQWHGEPQGADVLLGDSVGEMALYYGMADVVLLGGSFAPLGGQNLIEAAACACPVIMGPHTFNFAQAAELAQVAGAALEVPDMDHAVRQARLLLRDPQALQNASDAAQALSLAHRGAALRTALAIQKLLG